MKRTARNALATALLISGATLATAQNGPPVRAYRWKPVLNYDYFNYYGPPCYGRFYNLAPYYFPGDYPGAPAYRYWALLGLGLALALTDCPTADAVSRQLGNIRCNAARLI